MAGEYRLEEVLSEIPEELAAPIRKGDIRIALTHTPVTGARKAPELNEEYAAAYENSSQPKYARGLRDGSMVIIEIRSRLRPEHGGTDTGDEKVWAPGELFMRS